MQIFRKIEFSTLAWFFLRNAKKRRANAFFCYFFLLLLHAAAHSIRKSTFPFCVFTLFTKSIHFVSYASLFSSFYFGFQQTVCRSVSSKFTWVQSPFVLLPMPLPSLSSPPVYMCFARARCVSCFLFSRVEMNIFFIRCVHIFFRFILFVIIRFCFALLSCRARQHRQHKVSARQHGCEECAPLNRKWNFVLNLFFNKIVITSSSTTQPIHVNCETYFNFFFI